METIMPANLFKLPSALRALMVGLALTASVTACAPDMFQLGRSTQLDAYLSRIGNNCGQETIHGIEVWQLADDDGSLAGQEDFFIDQASMLLYGTITPEQWKADISGYFDDNSPRGQRAYNCIIGQLPTQTPGLPKAYREVMKAAPQVSGND
jgi:hypothetical protein